MILREFSIGILLLMTVLNGIVTFNPTTQPPESDKIHCLRWSTDPLNKLVCADVPEKDKIDVDVERMQADFKRWDRNHY